MTDARGSFTEVTVDAPQGARLARADLPGDASSPPTGQPPATRIDNPRIHSRIACSIHSRRTALKRSANDSAAPTRVRPKAGVRDRTGGLLLSRCQRLRTGDRLGDVPMTAIAHAGRSLRHERKSLPRLRYRRFRWRRPVRPDGPPHSCGLGRRSASRRTTDPYRSYSVALAVATTRMAKIVHHGIVVTAT